MATKQTIVINSIEVSFYEINNEHYISLTDMARFKDADRTNYVIQNWLRTRNALDFCGLWEKLYNPMFNSIEFDAFKTEAGNNSFVITPQQWIKKTNAKGMISKSGRYGGGTFAHRDIAFEFATWLSPEFKLYVIREFQRLKEKESKQENLEWNIKRTLAKVNYKIHTDAIQSHLIPEKLGRYQISAIYANEADLLNMALYGMTAKQWREANPDLKGNVRDHSSVEQLVVLSNLESMNAAFIEEQLSQPERLFKLNRIAIRQMKSLLDCDYLPGELLQVEEEWTLYLRAS